MSPSNNYLGIKRFQGEAATFVYHGRREGKTVVTFVRMDYTVLFSSY